MILTDEFARQASMEQDLGIPSALFAAPVREIIELGKSQIGFMNMFAIPLFQGVTDVMPAMAFCVEELQRNKAGWEEKIAVEQERARKNSDDSTTRDGMFSPRTMSLAHPSDATPQRIGNATLSPDMDLRKALLSKSPFSPSNGFLEERSPLPELSTTSLPFSEEPATPSPGEVSIPRNFSKPSQLQLSFATASAPGLLDHPSQDLALAMDGAPYLNGVDITPSLVTDPVIIDPPTTLESKAPESKQRSSDGTEGSSSAAGDWTSEAPSITTGKMPLSPSTQGTSIMSDSESIGKHTTSSNLTPTGTPTSRRVGTMESRSEDGEENKGPNSSVVMEKFGRLKKKPSRFRMNFWKRSKSASPPMPGDARVQRSEDGMST